MTMQDEQSNIIIRPLQNGCEREKNVLVSLVNRCYRGSENWTNEAHIATGIRATRAELERDAKDTSLDVFVAEDRATETIIGCIRTGVVNDTVVGTLEESMGYIGLFAVAPEYQSKGLGTRLSKFAEQHCRQKGVAKMALVVFDVRADIISWYERQGYRKTNRTADPVPLLRGLGGIVKLPTRFVLMVKDF